MIKLLALVITAILSYAKALLGCRLRSLETMHNYCRIAIIYHNNKMEEDDLSWAMRD